MSKFPQPAGGKDRCNRDSEHGKNPFGLDNVSLCERVKQADPVQVDTPAPRINGCRKRFTGKAVTIFIGSEESWAVDDKDVFASGQFGDIFANYRGCAGIDDCNTCVPALELPDQSFEAFRCAKDDILFDEERAVEIAVKNGCRIIIASARPMNDDSHVFDSRQAGDCAEHRARPE